MICRPMPWCFSISLGMPLAVVLDDQQVLPVLLHQLDHDVLGLAVLDRVVHGLLRDAVQMDSRVIVRDVHLAIALAGAGRC